MKSITPEFHDSWVAERSLAANHEHYGSGNAKRKKIEVSHFAEKENQKYLKKARGTLSSCCAPGLSEGVDRRVGTLH
jgi:hypothetical protein